MTLSFGIDCYTKWQVKFLTHKYNIIMKTALLFCMLMLLSSSQVIAQNLKGKVVDETGNPVSFANVVLLSRQDSSFVKGTISGEDGGFTINSS